MLLFGVCFVLHFIELSAGKGFWTYLIKMTGVVILYVV